MSQLIRKKHIFVTKTTLKTHLSYHIRLIVADITMTLGNNYF